MESLIKAFLKGRWSDERAGIQEIQGSGQILTNPPRFLDKIHKYWMNSRYNKNAL